MAVRMCRFVVYITLSRYEISISNDLYCICICEQLYVFIISDQVYERKDTPNKHVHVLSAEVSEGL